MKLIPASGSPRMQKALAHRYVHTIVSILLQKPELLSPIALLLRRYDQREPVTLNEDLENLRVNQSVITSTGAVTAPPMIIELIQTLSALYRQPDEDIRYQRGAILEVLVCRLVSSRYQPGECLGNQRFMDEHGRPITDQVDVAALSHALRQLEGYECKLKVNGIESADCTNLAYLASVASAADYRAQVGVVTLDSLIYMRRRLARLQPDPALKLFGLENIPLLADTPF